MHKKILVTLCAAIAVMTLGAALAAEKKAGRRHINLGDPARAGLPFDSAQDLRPFSDGVLAGDTLYLAGKIGIDPETGKPPADAQAEARLALDGLQRALKEAGMTMDDLVYVQVFCSDVALYDDFNKVYRSYFKKEFPARAFIGSGPLLRGGRFEVQGIAVKR